MIADPSSLGRTSARSASAIRPGSGPAGSCGRLRRLLVELERLVQHAHGELEVLLVDHDGDLDLGRRDHLDVDALVGQRLEHLRRDADVRAHADADDRHLADAGCRR